MFRFHQLGQNGKQSYTNVPKSIAVLYFSLELPGKECIGLAKPTKVFAVVGWRQWDVPWDLFAYKPFLLSLVRFMLTKAWSVILRFKF